ncbi:MAG: hypothetical protein NVSMB40_11040 [Aquirhabdus sp.]
MLVLRKVQKLFLAAVGIVIADLQLYHSYQQSLGLDGVVGAVVFGIAALLAVPALSLLGYQTTNKTNTASNVDATEDENITFDKILKKAEALSAASSKWQATSSQVVDANDASSLLRLRHCVAYVTYLAGMSQNPKAPSSITSNLSAGVHLRVATEMQNLLKLAMLKQGTPIADVEAARITQEDLEKMAAMVTLFNSGTKHQAADPDAHLTDELTKLLNIPETHAADFKQKLKKFNGEIVKDIAHWKGFKRILAWVKSLFKASAFAAAVTAPLVATGVMMGGFQKQITTNVPLVVANTSAPTSSHPSCAGSMLDPAQQQLFDQKLESEYQQLAANTNLDINAVKAMSPSGLQSAYPAIVRKMCSMSEDNQPSSVTLIPITPRPPVEELQSPSNDRPLNPKVPPTNQVPSRPTNKHPGAVERPVGQHSDLGMQQNVDNPVPQQETDGRSPLGSKPHKLTPMQAQELEYSIPYTNNDAVNSSPSMAQHNDHVRAMMDGMSSLRQRQASLYNEARLPTADVSTNRSVAPAPQVPSSYTAQPPPPVRTPNVNTIPMQTPSTKYP